MAENYKHLYEQTKKMLTMYQDELIPGFRKKIEELEARLAATASGGGIPIDVREKLVELLTTLLECEIAGDCSYLAKDWAENLIAHGATVQEWISVKDRLPEDSTTVNLYTRSRTVGTGFYDKHTKSWVQYYSGGAICVEVTHWMPLPQPPKGE